MSGPIVAGSPWTRRALAGMDPVARESIESRIPDGHRVIVAAGRNPSDLTLILRNYQGEVRRVDSRSIEIGCERLLPAEVVVEDHGGYIVTAEIA